MIRLVKQPGEALKHALLVSGVQAISALHALTVTARGMVPGGTALTVAHSLFAGSLMLTLNGGADGETYLVTAIVDDAGGARREEEVEVTVVDALWTMPDGGPSMLSVAEFVARVGLDEAIRMTDASGQGRIDRGILVGALADAQALAEAHLAGRVVLPLVPVPTIIKLVIGDIARARLYPDGAPDGIDAAAKVAMRQLERIQSGQLSLGIAPAVQDNAAVDPIIVDAGTRRYPDGLDGY